MWISLLHLGVTHANWKAMKEMHHMGRFPSSQQRQKQNSAAMFERGRETDSSTHTFHIIHL